jgi:S-formylglutathione hydrolase FrmB
VSPRLSLLREVWPEVCGRGRKPPHPRRKKSGEVVAAKSGLQERIFQSESLSRSMKYRILVPVGYFENVSSYPVLYLLHGWHGDYQNWSTLTQLVGYAKDLPVIIVMPDAGDSWYTDSASEPKDKFEQYVIHDLIAEIDQHWRTLRSPRRRAIAGLSMGGYGALKLALRYPEVFGFAASISGAFNAASFDLGKARPDLPPSLLMAFGADHSQTRERNDAHRMAAAVNPQITPYLCIDWESGLLVSGTKSQDGIDAEREELRV